MEIELRSRNSNPTFATIRPLTMKAGRHIHCFWTHYWLCFWLFESRVLHKGAWVAAGESRIESTFHPLIDLLISPFLVIIYTVFYFLKKENLEASLETMKHGFVKNRIYDTDGDGAMVLRDEVNLKILDSLFMYDCLKNLKGFPTFQEKLHRRRRLQSCKQALHQQCCLACSHKCKVCVV